MPSVAAVKAFDVVSDAVDEGTLAALCALRIVVSDTPFVVSRLVNVLKGKATTTGAQATPSWDDDSVFDQQKEKDNFRQYDEACDHVKEFYREQHGTQPIAFLFHSHRSLTLTALGCTMNREANRRVQPSRSRGIQKIRQSPHGHLGGYGEA